MLKPNHTIFDIRDFGAIADGETICSASIQAAIDACVDCGGGTVLITQGAYLTGTIELRSGVTLYLDRSASLVGSTDIKNYWGTDIPDYTNIYCTPILSVYPPQAIIYANNAEDLAIIGGGKIDGQGQSGKYFPNPDDPKGDRPTGIFFENCKRVTIQDIHINNTAFFATRFVMCKEMYISGVKIHTLQSANGDGLDFIGGGDVTISDCIIKAGDDCISLKAFEAEQTLRNFVITNCIMTSTWAAIRLGAESNANMQEITVSNCIFDCCGDGLKIQNGGGGIYENMIFSNITMRNVERPLFIVLNTFTFSQKPPCRPTLSVLRNLTFQNITATVSHDKEYEDIVHDKIPCVCISGTMEDRIENCTFDNLSFHSQGGETDKETAFIDIPEFLDYTGLYAESRHMKRRCSPASGMYIRHVANCSFHRIRFSVEEPDIRPVIVLDDAVDCDFNTITGKGSEHSSCLILTAGCQGLNFEKCKFIGESGDKPIVQEISGEHALRYNKGRETARSIDRIYAVESLVADAARAAERLLIIDGWERTGTTGDYTYTTTVDISEPNCNQIYLYFGWLFGDADVYINNEPTASRHIPDPYKWPYFWAVEMKKHVKAGKNEICVHMFGGQENTGILRPVEIRKN